MPTIEYRNRTWSYVDLAVHLKKGTSNYQLPLNRRCLQSYFIAFRNAHSRQVNNSPQSQTSPQPNYASTQLYRADTHLNDLRTTDHGSTDISSSETASRQST